MATVRDKLWIWGHEAGSHTGPGSPWGLEDRDSRVTPAEAARYLGVPNCVMVVYGNRPAPPFDAEAAALDGLRRVVWSVMGDLSSTRNDTQSDLEEVLRTARTHPNVVGGIMDDFLHDGRARYGVEQVGEIQRRLHAADRPMELWVVLYDHQLDEPLAAYFDVCDVVTFWTGKAGDLANLEANFERFVRKTPANRRVLGCYLHDYSGSKPMPVEAMKRQAGLGLRWLREGRIAGIIFLASCICDLGIEAVEWTRSWIDEVGETDLPACEPRRTP